MLQRSLPLPWADGKFREKTWQDRSGDGENCNMEIGLLCGNPHSLLPTMEASISLTLDEPLPYMAFATGGRTAKIKKVRFQSEVKGRLMFGLVAW